MAASRSSSTKKTFQDRTTNYEAIRSVTREFPRPVPLPRRIGQGHEEVFKLHAGGRAAMRAGLVRRIV